MQLVIRIDCDNEAFDNFEDEVRRVLERVMKQLDDGTISGICRDSNGNTVGEFVYSGHAERESQRG